MQTNDSIREALARTKTELTAARQLGGEIGRNVSRLADHAKALTECLKTGKPYELTITDHAMVRYVERHLGFNPQELVALVRQKIEPSAALLGDGSYPLTAELVAVVRNKTVITIKPNEY